MDPALIAWDLLFLPRGVIPFEVRNKVSTESRDLSAEMISPDATFFPAERSLDSPASLRDSGLARDDMVEAQRR